MTSFRRHCTLIQFKTMGSRKRQRLALARREKGRRYREAAIFFGYRSHFRLPTVVRNVSQVQGLNCRNCRMKPATCNASAEQKSKDSQWQSFLIDHISHGRIWYTLTNKICCYGKDRDYETISNKSEGKVKLLTSVEITCNNMDMT